MYPLLMNASPRPQGAENGCYGNRLSEHTAVPRHTEDCLSPRDDRPSVPVPDGLRFLPADGGSRAHRAVQVSPKVQAKAER